MGKRVLARATFVWGEDETSGEHGFIPQNMPNGNVVTGRVAAHDVCEHAVSTMGMTIDNEIQAFGAIAFGRMVTGWQDGDHFRTPTPKDLGEELGQLIADGYNADQHFSVCDIPRVRIERGAGEQLKELLHHCIKWFHEYEKNHGYEPDEDEKETQRFLIGKMRERGLLLLRHGWARARSLYRWPHALTSHYQDVATAVDKRLKYEECYGGEEMEVVLNTRTGEVKIHIKREEY